MGDFTDISRVEGETFLIPSQLNSDYPRKDFLGNGGYGSVFKLGSRDEKCLCSLAVKKFISPFDEELKARRCLRELLFLRSIKHENIVLLKFIYTTEDSLQEMNSVYLVTQWCGNDLSRLLKQELAIVEAGKKPLFSVNKFKRMISELLRALKYLTSANVIHRDVNPHNIAINTRFQLTLIDFGLARVMNDPWLTNNPGNKYYRAIETTAFGEDGVSEYNEKADLWSIGTILYEMFTVKVLMDPSNPAKDYPILKAIEVLGAVPIEVINRIRDEKSRASLLKQSRSRNERGEMVEKRGWDLLSHLTENASPWLRNDIAANGVNLIEFLNRTLNFDKQKRMTVDEALAHPFLENVRIREREIIARDRIPNEDEALKTIDQIKAAIWREIQNNPLEMRNLRV